VKFDVVINILLFFEINICRLTFFGIDQAPSARIKVGYTKGEGWYGRKGELAPFTKRKKDTAVPVTVHT
jgi:hypothetical protein